jgi:hypothetical protein
LHRRLRKLEVYQSLKADLLVETGTFYRDLLAERIEAIGQHWDAARERGEEVPVADPEQVVEMLRCRFGWTNLPAGAPATCQDGC